MFDSLNNLNETKTASYILARVVENNDPLFLQRVKVAIPTVLEGNVEDLPWLMPLHAHVGGFGLTHGVVDIPPIGAQVVVEFQNGSPYYGLVLGSVPEKRSEMEPLMVNYPNRRGWMDPSGNYFYIDSTEESVEVEFHHKSGTSIKILDSGEVQILTVSNTSVDVQGNATVNVTGNTEVTVEGDASVAVSGATEIASAGDMMVRTDAKLTLQGGSAIEMRAPRIDHNRG